MKDRPRPRVDAVPCLLRVECEPLGINQETQGGARLGEKIREEK